MGSIDMSRRTVLIAPVLLGAIAVSGKAYAAPPDPKQTLVLPYGDIAFEPWGDLPTGSGERPRCTAI
jgi:hypothetical protein